ncbi:unnamed protein product [Clavelina lepadiformis]|uniref:Ig-like domain-containing protein n=1 Tax=Clavelina lepadiformis TaxID=159417 RepID=A0ABP0FAF3_CLALP
MAVDTSSIYSDRADVSMSPIPASPPSFTTQLTIVQVEENERLVDLGSGGPSGFRQHLELAIKNCSSALPYNVVANATSRIFNSIGRFSCSNGGELFYSNGTVKASSDTTCLVSAKWSGQDNLQCWTAPEVNLASSSLEGNKLTVIEGDYLNLTCNYMDVVPSGNTSRFFVGNVSYTKSQGEYFTLTPTRNHSGKIVSCQAVTPYTEVYASRGRTPNYKLEVLCK